MHSYSADHNTHDAQATADPIPALALMLDSIGDGILSADLEHRCTFVNPAACRMMGYSAEECIGRELHTLVGYLRPDGSASPKGECFMLDSLRGDSSGRMDSAVLRRKDGTAIPVEYTAMPMIRKGQHTGAMVCFRDTSDRQRREAGLRASEARLQMSEAAAGVGTWEWNLRTDGITWTSETQSILGVSLDIPTSRLRHWENAIHPDDRAAVLEGLHRAIQSAEHWESEYRVVWPDRSLHWVSSRGQVIRDASGTATGIAGAVIDVTERKRLQEQLLQSQKMEAIGRLAGGIAHDFNNLLTVITGYASMLSECAPEPFRHNAELIQAAADRASALTRQLLAFSRKQVLHPQVIDLNSVITGLEPMLARVIGEDIELRIFLDRSLRAVQADPSQIEQVILNLVLNARDAMPSGGTLTLTTRNAELDAEKGEIHSLPPGPYSVVLVRDTGHGMSEQTKALAFEPFFTTKEPGKGTGLGLATAYGIVQQSGGAMVVSSAPGLGATFEVLLPCSQLKPAAAKPALPELSAMPGSGKILLVEDEPALRQLVARILSGAGYEVVQAACGEDAVRLVEGRLNDFDMLLTDVIMPGMSGLELGATLIAKRPDLPVLYVSGYSGHPTFSLPDTGDDAQIMQKPFTPNQLLARIRAVLGATK